jgi:hypothetical protein
MLYLITLLFLGQGESQVIHLYIFDLAVWYAVYVGNKYFLLFTNVCTVFILVPVNIQCIKICYLKDGTWF